MEIETTSLLTNKNEENSNKWQLSRETKTILMWIAAVSLLIIILLMVVFGVTKLVQHYKNNQNCNNNGLAKNGIDCNKPCKDGAYNLANGDCISCPNGIADNKLNCNQICDDPSNSYNLSNGDCTYCKDGVSMNKKACKSELIVPAGQNYKQNYRHYNRQQHYR